MEGSDNNQYQGVIREQALSEHKKNGRKETPSAVIYFLKIAFVLFAFQSSCTTDQL